MRGGGLHNFITFEEGEVVKDADNVPRVRWVKRGQAFCEMKTRKGRKVRENNQLYEVVFTEFYCRFFDAMQVEESWIIKHKDPITKITTKYKITGKFPDHERSNWMRFETETFNEDTRSK